MRAGPFYLPFSGLAILAIALVIGACAPARTGPGANGAVQVVVENNLIPPTTLTVWAVPEVGGRRMLGTVAPRATEAFRLDPLPAARYRLLARPTAGQEIASQPFTALERGVVRWDVRANLLRFEEAAEPSR